MFGQDTPKPPPPPPPPPSDTSAEEGTRRALAEAQARRGRRRTILTRGPFRGGFGLGDSDTLGAGPSTTPGPTSGPVWGTVRRPATA
jgi:hypothetical protein